MTRAITCPRCGLEITADTEGNLASGVVEHAARTHDHELSIEHILGTIRGEDPAAAIVEAATRDADHAAPEPGWA